MRVWTEICCVTIPRAARIEGLHSKVYGWVPTVRGLGVE